MFLAVGPITMSVIVLVIILQILLFRSRWGLRTRAVGEHPRAAETVGIDVIRLRYRNVILGGIFAGLAGAWLTMEFNASFQNGMTANRGFIALAAVIFGRWTPLGAFGAALLFAFSEALGIAIRSNPPPGELGIALSGLQASFPSLYNNTFGALPYVVTIIVLAGVVGRSIAPAAVGRPYVKEGAEPDERRDERDRARDILDLEEGRGPVAVLDDAGIADVLRATRRIAVVGASSDPGRPSFGVFRYLVHQGFECIPVNPNERHILGIDAYRSLAEAVEATGPFDMVDVFRRSELCVPHAHEAVAAGARCLWLQLGVVNWEAARIAADAGLSVVMDRCTAIEWRRVAARR